MKKFMQYIAVLFLFFTTVSVDAQVNQEQEWYGPLSQDDWEFNMLLGGTGSSTDASKRGGDWFSYDGQVDFSYFLTRYISAGFRWGGQYSVDRKTSEHMLNIGPVGKIHFFEENSKLVPYVGGQFNYNYLKSHIEHERPYDEHGWMYGPIFGIKYYYTSGISVFAEYQYRLFAGHIGDLYESQSSVFLGFSLTY